MNLVFLNSEDVGKLLELAVKAYGTNLQDVLIVFIIALFTFIFLLVVANRLYRYGKKVLNTKENVDKKIKTQEKEIESLKEKSKKDEDKIDKLKKELSDAKKFYRPAEEAKGETYADCSQKLLALAKTISKKYDATASDVLNIQNDILEQAKEFLDDANCYHKEALEFRKKELGNASNAKEEPSTIKES